MSKVKQLDNASIGRMQAQLRSLVLKWVREGVPAQEIFTAIDGTFRNNARIFEVIDAAQSVMEFTAGHGRPGRKPKGDEAEHDGARD
jgi:hypothetical protein